MIREFLKRLKIRTRIILVYISVLILSIILTFGVFAVINEKRVEQEVGEAAMQTVNALKGNLGFIFDNVTQFSDLIYFDKNVQKALTKIKSDNIDPRIHQTMQKSMVNMLLSGEYISSVFVFDSYNNYYSSYKTGPIFVNKEKVNQTKWYEKMKQAGGDVLFIHQSEGVLSFPTKKDKNYISLVREIFDVDNYEPLATLMIIVDDSTIQGYFDEVGQKYNSLYCIIDSDNNYIIKPSGYKKEMDKYLLDGEPSKRKPHMVSAPGGKMIMVTQDLGIEDWRLVGAIPLNSNSTSAGRYFGSWIILIIMLNLIFVFACSIVLTKLIFNPLDKVQKHMRLVEDGKLIELTIDNDQSDEINDLKKVFNQMIVSIKDLISKVKSEEKIIAKNELDIIQAQINPHFLYNTLDAISALALIEDHENCLRMTQALGNFYRNSLNSGQDLVTVKDEIACIESYITILNIRYDNKITMKYDIEERIKNYKILKLILQPVIENAAHHGIRDKMGKGTIWVRGYQDEDEMIFIITDDGIGMSQDRILEILEGRNQKEKSGFGLYSSIQRISLFYGIRTPLTITSEAGTGTEIAIRVKVIEGVGHENESIISR